MTEKTNTHDWLITADLSYTKKDPVYDETYHSTAGAWRECEQVFFAPFAATELISQPVWKILDVGFGLGLNWLFFVNQALRLGKKIRIVSLEKNAELLKLDYPVENLPQQTTPTHSTSLHSDAKKLWQDIKHHQKIKNEWVNADLLLADALTSLQDLANANEKFDLILQDAFSPKKNPEMWSAAYFNAVAKVCTLGTLLATYSSAKMVQDNMQAAGFSIQKTKGFAGKRERLLGVFNRHCQDPESH